jgi:hypothetical protein
VQLAVHQISMKGPATPTKYDHVNLLIFLDSIWWTTAAETAFFPFFPGEAKSSTIAPEERSRL